MNRWHFHTRAFDVRVNALGWFASEKHTLHALHLSYGLCKKKTKARVLKRVFCFPLAWIIYTLASSNGLQRPSTAANQTSSGSIQMWSTLSSAILPTTTGRYIIYAACSQFKSMDLSWLSSAAVIKAMQHDKTTT